MIDFRCTQCGRLLRTPDDAAGKQAQCPSCGAVQPVPSASAATASPNPTTDVSRAPAHSASPNSTAVTSDVGNPYAGTNYSTELAPGSNWAASGFVPTRLELGEILNRTWTIFRDRLGACLGTFALSIFGIIGLYMVVAFGVVLVMTMPGKELLTIPVAAVVTLVAVVALLVLAIGITRAMLKIARGQEVTWSDYSGGAQHLPRFFGGWLLWTIIQYGTMFACLAPAFLLQASGRNGIEASLLSLGGNLVYYVISTLLMLVFWMAPLLIIDQGAGPIAALMRSRDLTSGKRLVLFLIGLVATLIYVAGFFACLVGAFFTAPFAMLMGVVTYLTVIGQPTAAPAPATAGGPVLS